MQLFIKHTKFDATFRATTKNRANSDEIPMPKKRQTKRKSKFIGATMGRKKIELDPIKIRELSAKGMTQVEMAKELGVCHVTLARRMGALRKNEGLLLEYRSIQSLQLTSLQATILASITPEKIKEASLKELASAFHILKKAELAMNPPQAKSTGFVEFLIELEKSGETT